MSNQPYPARYTPRLSINPEEITARLDALAHADLCECCELPVTRARADIARLLSQVSRLCTARAAERLRSANLEAAIRAALSAYDDGETDPLAYLRDEIAGSTGGACGA